MSRRRLPVSWHLGYIADLSAGTGAKSACWVVMLCALWPGIVSGQQPEPPGQPPPIEFQSRGLDYEAITKDGITVMFAQLPARIKDFNVMQVTITNGSLVAWTVKPVDFSFVRQDGATLPAVSADEVVESLLQ
ncbi:MAG: hypothetical protein JO061_01900, partial [Acidobacteriaceae bacterium]|nr:hypothetical protein [Acidobacteriaceae bacterium]